MAKQAAKQVAVTMSVELHLPDLPEVPLSLGAAPSVPGATQLSWFQRLRQALLNYLPLLLMALLALGSWWLVKSLPAPLKPRAEAAPRSEPDYTMSNFVLERFEPAGRLKLRIEGAQMRHFPDTDRIEIETVKIQAFAPDGRVTLAHAQRALSNGDGSEVQLIGAAQVDSIDRRGEPLRVNSEFLHLFTAQERLRTHLPVLVKRTGADLHAGALYYDHGLGRVELIGNQHAVFTARVPPKAASSPSTVKH